MESGYWQAFCREKNFQLGLPTHLSGLATLGKQPQRPGSEELLHLPLAAGIVPGVIQEPDPTEILVNTTAMEKVITFSTDSKLCA